MKYLALVSGGKDSFFNIHHCLTQGHELIAIGNLYPQQLQDEIDSFMFQTVGHDIIDYYAQCLDVPLYRQAIMGHSKNQLLEYSQTNNDEIEDLYQLIKTIVSKHPDIEGVSCGAILSHYQRTRVENICDRFGLTSMAFLWQRDQDHLLQEMSQSQLDARIIKVAAIGLLEKHLGKSITEMYPQLVKLNQMYDVHICGEGGEFETIVLDCNFFKYKKLIIVDQQTINSSSGVSYLKFKVELVDKTPLNLFEPVPIPNVVDEEFEELLLDQMLSTPDYLVTSSSSDYSNNHNSPNGYIEKVDNNLYISNLTDNALELSDQVNNIFKSLHTILKDYDLDFTDIQHVTLLVSDMSKFAEINSIYQQKFCQYLPPSRVCIETHLSNYVQLSCKCIIKELNTRKGIHIRSRSYWAPQNIGPYSQARVQEQYEYNYATISGQIPLNPATMELITDQDKAMVLTLQHFYRIKTLINIPEIANILCFTTGKIDMKTFINVWRNYCDMKESKEVFNKLIILQVTQLPKNAIIEIGGDTFKKLGDPYEDSDSDNDRDLEAGAGVGVLHQLKQRFPDLIVTDINNLFNIILFVDSPDEIQTLFKIISNSINQLKLYCNGNNYNKISTHKFEYLPVINVFNHQLKPVNYGINLTLKT